MGRIVCILHVFILEKERTGGVRSWDISAYVKEVIHWVGAILYVSVYAIQCSTEENRWSNFLLRANYYILVSFEKIFMYFILCVWVFCLNESMQYPWWSHENIISPWSEVIYSCKPPCEYRKQNLNTQQQQEGLLMEISL